MSVARYVRAVLPVLAIAACAVAANLHTVRYPQRIDLTHDKVYSLGATSRKVVAQIRQPVVLTFFYDSRSRGMLDQKYLVEQYAALSPHVTARSYDPVLEPAAAERHGVRFAGTTIVTSGERRVEVNTPGENALTNALLEATSNVSADVCFTDGHIESNPFSLQAHDHFEHGDEHAHGHDHSAGGKPLTLHERHGMGRAANALAVQGYQVRQVLAASDAAALDTCSVVVVASPQVPFEAAELARLEAYLAAGGSMLLLLEPAVETGFERILDAYGVRISHYAVQDPAQHYRTDPATPAVSDHARHRATRGLPLTFFPGAAELLPGIAREGLSVEPLMTTSDAALRHDRSDDQPRARTLAVMAANDDNGSRLVVVGDGDFATNSFFSALGNGQLLLNLVAELSRSQRMLNIVPREYAVASLSMTNNQIRATFFVTVVLGPCLVLGLAALVIWRRR